MLFPQVSQIPHEVFNDSEYLMVMRQSKRRTNKDSGFTMIELLVVLVVLLVFTTIVWSTYQFSNTIRDKLMQETDGLKVSLRFAQAQAFNDDTDTWGINFPNNTTYRLYKNGLPAMDANGNPIMIPVKVQTADPGHPAAVDPLTEACPENCHQLSGNVQITSTVPIINFDKWGRPVDGAGNLLTQNTPITLAVVVQGQITDTYTFNVSKNTGLIY